MSTIMDRPRLTTLPAEILEAIFLHLDPPSLISVSQTNKLIKQLTTDAPLVWRNFCRTRFKTWDARHHIATKFAGPLSDVDWRALYISKVTIERRTRELLQSIIATQQGRIKSINEIADFGYDAKETLLEALACPDDAEDVLARRYYANAVLERIQREIAITVWKDVIDDKDVPLETALGAYDMFATVGDDVDIGLVSEDIDHLASGFLDKYPNFHNMSPRIQASTLTAYLRAQGFEGVTEASYTALRNSFIGLVLRSSAHQSLPLISVAIFCAVARRLGLDARPCGFPYHVYALVYASKDYDLNGKYKPTTSTNLDSMYLDPFRSSSEVQKGDLVRMLREMGAPASEHEQLLGAITTRDMVMRTAKNIMNSVQTIRHTQAGARGIQPLWLRNHPDQDNAFYATLWAMLMLSASDDQPAVPGSPVLRRRQFLPYLLDQFETHPWDVTLLLRFAIPLFYEKPEGHRLLQFVQSSLQVDAMPKPVRPRSERTANVNFKVGQLFQHKRYYYEGVITGWDLACNASKEWIQNMRVDHLPNGRHQAFYHVLVCDKSVRYVAEENIQPAPPETKPSEAMLRLAGRHFKRWDDENHVFVSNVLDEYPDC